MKARKIVLIPGDGIGPEICEATKNVLSAVWVKLHKTLMETSIPPIS
jgi:isocitrate/isopropylmalate dehydrogenase